MTYQTLVWTVALSYFGLQAVVFFAALRNASRRIESWRRDVSSGSLGGRQSDAIEALDDELASEGASLFQLRMGIMAPLVGVTVTALGFIFFESESTKTVKADQLGDVLSALEPLFYGVLTGAVLGITNQLLAQLTRARIASWRNAAVRALRTRHAEAVRKSEEAHERADRLLDELADRVERFTNRLDEAIDRAAQSSEKKAEALGAELDRLTSGLTRVAEACETRAATVDDTLSRACETLDNSAARFRDGLDESTRQSREAGEQLHTSLKSARAAADRTREAADQQKSTIDSLTASMSESSEAFKGQLEQAGGELSDSASSFARASERNEQLVERLASTAETLANRCEQFEESAVHSLEQTNEMRNQLGASVSRMQRVFRLLDMASGRRNGGR